MRLTARKVQYACAALFELAVEYGASQPVQVHVISDRQKVPTNYMVQILIALRQAGLVQSVRGAQGGYRLAVPPDQITLAQVVSVIDGPLCARDNPVVLDKRLASHWLENINHSACQEVERRLEAVTFADLVEQYGQVSELSYSI